MKTGTVKIEIDEINFDGKSKSNQTITLNEGMCSVLSNELVEIRGEKWKKDDTSFNPAIPASDAPTFGESIKFSDENKVAITFIWKDPYKYKLYGVYDENGNKLNEDEINDYLNKILLKTDFRDLVPVPKGLNYPFSTPKFDEISKFDDYSLAEYLCYKGNTVLLKNRL